MNRRHWIAVSTENGTQGHINVIAWAVMKVKPAIHWIRVIVSIVAVTVHVITVRAFVRMIIMVKDVNYPH